ncbi:MAG: hypothetical protein Ct9H300mP14_09130 [Gammaproteobacteria bacterium]|nr:MAG: hypothetical protein Ct9H300mP14_09130 [Gammaproteobacteria bacterium]
MISTKPSTTSFVSGYIQFIEKGVLAIKGAPEKPLVEQINEQHGPLGRTTNKGTFDADL